MVEEPKFRWLFDSAPDAMVVVDEAGKIQLANPLVEQLFGYTRDELLGRPVEMLIPERFRAGHVAHRQGFNRQPRTRPMGAGLALYGQRSDGSEFPVEISLSASRTADGMLSLAAIRDVSERTRNERELQAYRDHLQELVEERTEALQAANQRLEAEVRERARVEQAQARLLEEVAAANEELKSFAYVVSHDLKAPLRGIDSLANWIRSDYAHCFDADGQDQMELLIGRVHRMNALIDGILQYSRLGRVREQKAPVDLEAAVRGAVDLLSLPESVDVQVCSRLPTVMGEQTRLVQLFQNLIGNAVRHNDKPAPRVRIACRELPGAWEVSVADNGPGIDDRHHERIFQMFQTLKPRDDNGSTGIGLTLVKRIVENAGGSIRVEAPPEGGTRFVVTLPREAESEGGACGQAVC